MSHAAYKQIPPLSGTYVQRETANETRTMNSTILIPKCSSTIVLTLMLAAPSQCRSSEYDALTVNWTCFCKTRGQETHSKDWG